MSRRLLPGGEPMDGRDDDPLEALVVDAPAAAHVSTGPEALPVDGPRIYAASLTDYNTGLLHGTWVDASLPPDEVQAQIDRMLAASPTARRSGEVAEEWGIHDYDGFGRFVDIDEYESLDTIHLLAQGFIQYGDAFGAWTELIGVNDHEAIAQFEEHYLGEFTDREAFGNEQLEDLGFDPSELPGVPEALWPYVHVDISGWVRDMELSGAIATREGGAGVYVFWAY